jgi:hypothetical protein
MIGKTPVWVGKSLCVGIWWELHRPAGDAGWVGGVHFRAQRIEQLAGILFRISEPGVHLTLKETTPWQL